MGSSCTRGYGPTRHIVQCRMQATDGMRLAPLGLQAGYALEHRFRGLLQQRLSPRISKAAASGEQHLCRFQLLGHHVLQLARLFCLLPNGGDHAFQAAHGLRQRADLLVKGIVLAI